MSITFQINVYEKTYKNVLESTLESFLKILPKFDEYVFIDNGVVDKEHLRKLLENFPQFVLYTTGEHDEEVLTHFDIKDLGVAYKYTIPHLYSIYFSKSDYIMHVSEDILDLQIENFVEDSVKLLENNSDIISTIPNWGAINIESHEYRENFGIAFGFSDQVYVLKKDRFNDKIFYNYYHVDSQRYPNYGGESFEKRINSYMRCLNLKRAIHKNSSYRHEH
jgi:imidazoleglycerol phosphate dehydratase HisB